MTGKRFKLEVEDDMYYTIFDNQSTDEEDKLYGLDDEQICDLLNKLYEENQQYKALLQDMGLLMSDEDVMCIRKDIAEKFIKPLCKENGFDVDVDCTNGFTIIPKGEYE